MQGRWLISTVVATALCALTGCGSKSGGPLNIAMIGDGRDVFASGLRLSEGAQVIRGATAAGLVALDAKGEIEPALADRWIVTEDGTSYIFRLREGTWPDGAELTGESARAALRQAMRGLQGTSLALDLAPIANVRAMAGRVVEIDLKAPMPDFLRLLAQPELALSRGGQPSGPMVLRKRSESSGVSITIGNEHDDPALENFTLVTAQYHVGALNGVIGVIGPTRMPYDKVISLVTHTSQLVTDLLD